MAKGGGTTRSVNSGNAASTRSASGGVRRDYDSLSQQEKATIETQIWGIKQERRSLDNMEENSRVLDISSRELDEQSGVVERMERDFERYMNSLNLSDKEKERLRRQAGY